MSPGKPISFQPARFLLPPYSGLAYRPSMVCSNSRLVNVPTDCVARILSCLAWLAVVKSPPASWSSAVIPFAYWSCQAMMRLRQAILATGSSGVNRAIRSGPDVCRLLHGPPAKMFWSSRAPSIVSM